MEVQLGKLFSKLVNGGTPSTDIASYWGGSIPWVTGADFTSRGIGEFRRYVSESGIRSSSTSVVDPGNLLVVTRTGVGKLAIAKEPIAISQDITGVYPDPTKTDTLFLYFLLVKELEELKKLNQGTSINGIIRSDFEKHLVKIPAEIHVQQKIARILQTIDQAIEKTEALIEKYQHIKAGLMHDLFTRGIGADGKLRPPHEQAPELYQETPIGWIPKEWKFDSLKNIFGAKNIVNGPFGSDLLTSELKKEGISVLYCQDIKPGVFTRISNSNVTPFKAAQLAFCNVRKNDILLAKVGSPPCDSCVYEEESSAVVTQDVIRIRPSSEYGAEFFSSWFNSGYGRQAIKKISIEGTRERVSLGEFKELTVPFPDIAEQIAIGRRISQAQKFIAEEKRNLIKLKQKKSGLMHDLLTGKVQVNVNEPNTAAKA
ncbi:restriction endonuclease subunit S [Methylomicrobium lacus]|uniref:restriction endonuclease subunit S n=1 Tax=Methylomicrobium lacus TaxID=136992 RepID=UPI0013773A20|nr:restriction endonuclease subunit S [Methylomicrobium lacus]